MKAIHVTELGSADNFSLVDLPTMRKLDQYLTGRGDVYRVELATTPEGQIVAAVKDAASNGFRRDVPFS